MEEPEELSESDKALVETAKKQAEKLMPAQRTRLLDLVNKGDAKSMQEIDGVGGGKAANVIKDRPYTSVEDIIMVDGIGLKTSSNSPGSAPEGRGEARAQEIGETGSPEN